MRTGMESFFTRSKANNGIQLPLYLPDGTKSEHTFTIRGVDSDVFREADAEARRNAMDIAQITDMTERAEAIKEGKLRLIASLVMAWTFDQPCTPEAVVNFLREAPQLADAIDQVASRRSLFFAQGLSSSPSTRKRSSVSTKSRKAPSKRSAPV